MPAIPCILSTHSHAHPISAGVIIIGLGQVLGSRSSFFSTHQNIFLSGIFRSSKQVSRCSRCILFTFPPVFPLSITHTVRFQTVHPTPMVVLPLLSPLNHPSTSYQLPATGEIAFNPTNQANSPGGKERERESAKRNPIALTAQ